LYNRYSSGNIVNYGKAGYLMKVLEDEAECLDCPIESEFKVKVDLKDEKNSLKIDSTGFEVKTKDEGIRIDSSGVKANSESVKVNIDSNGIEITTDEQK